MLTGDPRPGGRCDGGHRHVEVAVGPVLGDGLDQLVPLVLVVHGLFARQQLHENFGVLLQHLALVLDSDADHRGVTRKRTWAEAEHEPTPGQLVGEEGSVGAPQRVVIRQRQDAGAELDVAGLGCGVGDEHEGVGDDLGAGRVVLADPDLVVAQSVQQLDRFQVPLDARDRVLSGHGMEGGHEDAKTHG